MTARRRPFSHLVVCTATLLLLIVTVRADQWYGTTHVCSPENLICGNNYCANSGSEVTPNDITSPSDLTKQLIATGVYVKTAYTSIVMASSDTVDDTMQIAITSVVSVTELSALGGTFADGRYKCVEVQITWKGRTITSDQPDDTTAYLIGGRQFWCGDPTTTGEEDAFTTANFDAIPELDARDFVLKYSYPPKMAEAYTSIKYEFQTRICIRTDTCDASDFCGGQVCTILPLVPSGLASATETTQVTTVSNNYHQYIDVDGTTVGGDTLYWRYHFISGTADAGDYTEGSQFSAINVGVSLIPGDYVPITGLVAHDDGGHDVYLQTTTIDSLEYYVLTDSSITWYGLTIPLSIWANRHLLAQNGVIFETSGILTSSLNAVTHELATGTYIRAVPQAGTCNDASVASADWMHEARVPQATRSSTSQLLDDDADITKEFYVPYDLHDDATGYKRYAFAMAARCPVRPTETWGTTAATNPFPSLNVEQGQCTNLPTTFHAAWDFAKTNVQTWSTFNSGVAAGTYTVDDETVSKDTHPAGATGTSMAVNRHVTAAEQAGANELGDATSALDEDALVIRWDSNFNQWVLCNNAFPTCRDGEEGACGSTVTTTGNYGDDTSQINRALYSSVTYVTYDPTAPVTEFTVDCAEFTDTLNIIATLSGTAVMATQATDMFRMRSTHVEMLTCSTSTCDADVTGNQDEPYACDQGTTKRLAITSIIEVDKYAGGHYVLCPWAAGDTTTGVETDSSVLKAHTGTPIRHPRLLAAPYNDNSDRPVAFIGTSADGAKAWYTIKTYTRCMATNDKSDAFMKWGNALSYDYSYELQPRDCTADAIGDGGCNIRVTADIDTENCKSPSGALWPLTDSNWHIDFSLKWQKKPVDYTILRTLGMQIGILPQWDTGTMMATGMDAMASMKYMPWLDYTLEGDVPLKDVYRDCDTTAECKYADGSNFRVNSITPTDKVTVTIELNYGEDDTFVPTLDLFTYDVLTCGMDATAHPALLSCMAGTLGDQTLDCADLISDCPVLISDVPALHQSCAAWSSYSAIESTLSSCLSGWAVYSGNEPYASISVAVRDYEADQNDHGVNRAELCRQSEIESHSTSRLTSEGEWGSAKMCYANTECKWYPEKFTATGKKRTWDAFIYNAATANSGTALVAGHMYTIMVNAKVFDCNGAYTVYEPVRRALRTDADRALTGSSSSGSDATDLTPSGEESANTVLYVKNNMLFYVGTNEDGGIHQVVYDMRTDTASTPGDEEEDEFELGTYIIYGAVICAILCAFTLFIVWVVRRHATRNAIPVATAVSGAAGTTPSLMQLLAHGKLRG
jgi:hypothetical protein